MNDEKIRYKYCANCGKKGEKDEGICAGDIAIAEQGTSQESHGKQHRNIAAARHGGNGDWRDDCRDAQDKKDVEDV